MIEPPKKLKLYNRINPNSYLGYIVVFCIVLFVGNSLFIKEVLGMHMVIAGTSSFAIVLTVIAISFLYYKFIYGKTCPTCKKKYTEFIHKLKAHDLLVYDDDYHIDQNRNVVSTNENLKYNICDIWSICESCKICRLAKMRVQAKHPSENCKLNHEPRIKKIILEKNNIYRKKK